MILNKNSNTWLVLRTLLPSAASLAVSFVVAVGIIGLHLFLLSNSQSDLLLPHLTGVANDQLAQVYQESVQQRLDQAFGNTTFGFVLTALVWGMAGLFFTVSDFLLSNLKDLRSADKADKASKATTSLSSIHPLKNQIVIRLLWRALIGVTIIVVTLAMSSFISDLFRRDILLLSSSSVLAMAKYLALNLAAWLAIFHTYVVLFRFFVLRTRVFGEIIY